MGVDEPREDQATPTIHDLGIGGDLGRRSESQTSPLQAYRANLMGAIDGDPPDVDQPEVVAGGHGAMLLPLNGARRLGSHVEEQFSGARRPAGIGQSLQVRKGHPVKVGSHGIS